MTCPTPSARPSSTRQRGPSISSVDVGNANGGVRKLRDLQAYLRAQSEKSIPKGTSEFLSSYLENIIQQVFGGDDICSLP